MPRYKLTVAYDGTEFHGWQHQAGPEGPDGPPLRTVQGVLQEAVRAVVRQPVDVVGASRTDAGVHAVGQVAAFTAETSIPIDRLPAAINARLPDDVQVRRAGIVGDAFNPIRDCIAKGYRYRLAYDRSVRRPRPLFSRRIVAWSAYALDPARMSVAAADIEGRHDFTSFTRLHHGRESTVRTVHRCTVTAPRPSRCAIDVSGDGFLYNMVRIIAGTLVDVGRGVIAPDGVPDIIAARDRRAAGPTMPPEGLCLMWIEYGGRGQVTEGLRD